MAPGVILGEETRSKVQFLAVREEDITSQYITSHFKALKRITSVCHDSTCKYWSDPSVGGGVEFFYANDELQWPGWIKELKELAMYRLEEQRKKHLE